MKKMTQANLEAAFAGESQACMKYTIFADKAEEEGYPEVARLFRATAFAERVHATNHLRELGGIADTATNLGGAISGENYENVEMYPAFDAVATLQGEKGAKLSIHYALEAEKIHEVLYGDAKKTVESNADVPANNVYVCANCGHTIYGEIPEKCPICAKPKDWYRKF